MRVASFLASACLIASCVDAVPMDNAACPCIKGYYCAKDGLCHENADVVSQLSDQKYIVDIDSKQWAEPPGFAAALDADDNYEGVYPVFAFQISNVDPRAMTFTALLGTVRNGIQDRGLETYEMQGTLEIIDEETAAFTLGPTDVQSIVFGPTPPTGEGKRTVASYYGLTLTGLLGARGSEIHDGNLSAVLDAREIYTLFYLTDAENGEDLCDTLDTSSAYACLSCPFARKVHLCLTFRAESLAFPNAPDLTLNPVAGFDGKYL